MAFSPTAAKEEFDTVPQGIEQISLRAIEANSSALEFWFKMGFNITRTIPAKQYGSKTHQVYVMNRNAIRLTPSLRIAKA